MADTNMKFLSQAGLAKFWELIKTKFVSSIALDINENGAVFTINKGDGSVQDPSLVIPMASETNAGLMSAAQAKTVNEFSEGVAALIPLTAVKVKGTAAELADRAVNIDFVYNTNTKTIDLIDKNNSDAVLTSIDATDFIKDGMLSTADIVVKEDGKTYLQLTFNTDAGKEDVFVDVSDMFVPYQAGSGLELTDRTFSVKTNGDYLVADGNGLAVTDALWTKVGELDTAVADAAAEDAQKKADAAQAAAIAAAAEDATKKADAAQAAAIAAAQAKAEELDATNLQAAKDYADGKDAENLQAAKDYADAEIEKLQESLGKADSAVQEVKAGSEYVTVADDKCTVDLAEAVKTSLAAADSAVQSVTGTEKEIVVSGDAKNPVVGLADEVKASLGKADSAIQSVDFTANADNAKVEATVSEGNVVIDLMPMTDAEIAAIVNPQA